MPGFRPGKAPRRLLEARMGTEIARDQALRDSLPEYYAEAVVAEDVDVIAPPEIDITAGEEEGDVEFDAVVEVRPQVTVEGHDALRIEIEKPEVGDEAIAQQVDSLRERFADLEDSRDAAHRRRLRRDRHQGLHRRRVDRGPHRHRLPLRGRFGDRRAEARRGAARQAPRRHPQVHRHAARALRRAGRRRGRLPGAREGRQEEGAPRAHRRVGLPRSASSTPSRSCRDDVRTAPRHVRAGPGLDGRCGRRSSRPPPRSCPTTSPRRSSTARWSAASTTSRTGSRSRGSG